MKENSIKYLIIDTYDQIPKCIKTEEIKDTMRKKTVRNFFHKTLKNKYKIIKIKDIKCS